MTHLLTQRTKDGVQLLTRDGSEWGWIRYRSNVDESTGEEVNPAPTWVVEPPDDAPVSSMREWISYEAAEFFALALYLEQGAIDRL